MVVGLVGGGGGGDLEPRLSPWSMEELEAVDIVSLAFTVFKAFGFESILWQRSWGNALSFRLVVFCLRGITCLLDFENFGTSMWIVDRPPAFCLLPFFADDERP